MPILCRSDDIGQVLTPRAGTFCGIQRDNLSARATNAPERIDRRGDVDIGIGINYLFKANDGDIHHASDCPDIANASDADSSRSLLFGHGGKRGDEPGMIERRF